MLKFVVTLCMLGGAAAGGLRQVGSGYPVNVVGAAGRNPDLSTLVTAIKAAGLVDTLAGKGPFTVFAPTNEAFAALPKATLTRLLDPANKAELADLLTYHVAAGRVLAKDLMDMQMLTTVEGQKITVRVAGGNTILVNSGKVVSADNKADNGIIHIIDEVLMPPAAPTPAPTPAPKNIVELAESVTDLSTLVTAVQAAGLVDTLAGKGPFTVFAPTNEAFKAVPAATLARLLDPAHKAELVSLLEYHVVKGSIMASQLKDMQMPPSLNGQTATVRVASGDIFINSAKVTVPDNKATNGIVHIIDAVLMPPATQAPTPAPLKDIVSLAASVHDLSTLVSAVQAAGLVKTLSSTGPFTVFAPSNEAFAALPRATLQRLLCPEHRQELVSLLEYHVVKGSIMASQLKDMQMPPSLNGQTATVRVVSGDIFINSAKVTAPDNKAANGVVHIIDAVLMPPPAQQTIATLVAMVNGGDQELATFDGAVETTRKFSAVNDPVMGGQSTSTFVVDKTNKLGVWQGEVKVVPFLHAPGFCTIRSQSTGGINFPDVSGSKAFALTLINTESSELTTFQAQIMTAGGKSGYKQGTYSADFTAPATGKATTVVVPWSSFRLTWRGENISGPALSSQLGEIVSIGIGSSGKAGKFKLEIIDMKATSSEAGEAALEELVMQQADSNNIVLTTFDGARGTTQSWRDVNDPVMGGQSEATFKVDTQNKVGVFDGETKIVPSLKAPGFCNMQASRAKFPDISKAKALALTVRSSVAYSGFKVAMGPALRSSPFGNSYKADVVIPVTSDFTTIVVPFTNFSSSWSAYTGEPTKTCAENPSVCPQASYLRQLSSLEITAEGVAGKFHLEVKSVAAVL